MADQKITELTELTSGQIADTDVIPIVDVDADATKKWTWASVKADILSWIGAVTATFTNKTIDADNNTITNIGDEELKAGIDAAKIGAGSVSNTEFGYLDGVTSAIQTQLANKQPLDAQLTSLAALVPGTEGRLIEADGLGGFQMVDAATAVQDAGALMDSEVTDLAGIKALQTSTLQVKPTEGAFVDGDKTKLDGIEVGADVTDATNVIDALSGAAITVGVVATTDKLLWQDADDSDALKYSTVQSILDLGSGGAFSEDVNGAYYNGNVSINNTATQTDAALHVKGDGTTSATSALLIEDSAGTELYDFQDGGVLNLRNGVNIAGYVSGVSGYINIWRKAPEGFGRVGGYLLASSIRVHGDINDSTYIDLFGVSHATYPNRIRVKGTGGMQMVDGTVLLAAATTSIASLNMPSGTAPSSPVEGDMWYDGTNLKFRDSSTTRTISWT